MKNISCPICFAPTTARAYSGNRQKSDNWKATMKASGSDSRGRDIYSCKNCGVYFCHPMPDESDLLESYNSGEDENFVSQNIFRYKTFKSNFGKFLKNTHLPLSDVHVTDIGAASGIFLKMIEDSGGLATGFEANSWLVNYGKTNYKVNLHEGSVRNFTASSTLLEIVTLWDVLEHLAKPREDLLYLASHLKPKSIILVSLPSTDSKTFKLLRWRWPMHLDVHIFYYNKKSLNTLFNTCGFKLIYESKYPQLLSLGYLMFRGLKIFFPKLSDSRGNLLTRSFLNSIPLKYSIGQRIYAFEKL